MILGASKREGEGMGGLLEILLGFLKELVEWGKCFVSRV